MVEMKSTSTTGAGSAAPTVQAPDTPVAAAANAVGQAAVREAVAEAGAGIEGRDPSVVLIFPSPEIEPALVALQAREASRDLPVAGMTCVGGIGEPASAPGASCSAIAFDRSVRAGVGVGDHASRDPRGAGRAAAAAACAGLDLSRGHPLLLLFLDPAAGDQSDMIAGAYDVTGPTIPFAGGGSGARNGVQFAHHAGRRDSVVAVALCSPQPIGVGIAHGCRARGAPAIVTRAEGRTVLELDGRAAETVYLEKLDRLDGRLDDSAFTDLAVMHPLAQPELTGDVRLRHVFGRAADGGLACATAIPPNAAVAVFEQTPSEIVSSAHKAVADALAPLPGPPRAALVFDCAGRKQALGAALDEEVAAIEGAVGDVPLAGGFTHGEVGRVRGAKGDRNHALVVVAFG